MTFAEARDDRRLREPVKQISRAGKIKTVADLLQFENAENPDGEVRYGVPGLDEECAASGRPRRPSAAGPTPASSSRTRMPLAPGRRCDVRRRRRR